LLLGFWVRQAALYFTVLSQRRLKSGLPVSTEKAWAAWLHSTNAAAKLKAKGADELTGRRASVAVVELTIALTSCFYVGNCCG
jgi:hypothetical protein